MSISRLTAADLMAPNFMVSPNLDLAHLEVSIDPKIYEDETITPKQKYVDLENSIAKINGVIDEKNRAISQGRVYRVTLFFLKLFSFGSATRVDWMLYKQIDYFNLHNFSRREITFESTLRGHVTTSICGTMRVITLDYLLERIGQIRSEQANRCVDLAPLAKLFYVGRNLCTIETIVETENARIEQTILFRSANALNKLTRGYLDYTQRLTYPSIRENRTVAWLMAPESLSSRFTETLDGLAKREMQGGYDRSDRSYCKQYSNVLESKEADPSPITKGYKLTYSRLIMLGTFLTMPRGRLEKSIILRKDGKMLMAPDLPALYDNRLNPADFQNQKESAIAAMYRIPYNIMLNYQSKFGIPLPQCIRGYEIDQAYEEASNGNGRR